jgi:hypothetical protein
VLIGWTALYLASVRRAVDLIPLRSYSFGTGWEGMLFNGILGGAGLALVVPLFLPSRWRRSDVSEDFEAAEARDLMADLTDGPDLGGGPRPFSPDEARTRPARPGLPRATGSFPEL